MEKKLKIKTIVTGLFQENCYVVSLGDEGLIIDPGDDAEEILSACAGLDIKYILLTHAHVDHVGALKTLWNVFSKNQSQPKILMHKGDLFLLELAPSMAKYFGYDIEDPPEPSGFLEDSQELDFAGLKVKVIHVPGHSPGGLSFFISDSLEKHLFTGDILFAGSIGRTDLPGGNYNHLIYGIKTKLLILPPETIVYPGHGPTTTIGREKISNPFLLFS